MAHYVDSKQLERFWFEWAMASGVEPLEPFRQAKALYSRVSPDQIGPEEGEVCNNPWLDKRDHYIALIEPVRVTSVAGKVNIDTNTVEIRATSTETHQQLLNDGFYLEPTEPDSWHRLFFDLQKMCEGISRAPVFANLSPDDREETAQEALTMLTDKIRNRKIRYMPGKAPVFNFLTTAIYRCIYNHLRKSNRYKKQLAELQDKMLNGDLDLSMRSYKPIKGQV